MSLTYLGVTRYASQQFESFGSLETLKEAVPTCRAPDQDLGRKWTSTTQGAISTILVGLVYLLFAPFLATCFAATEHHFSGDDHLVVLISVTGTGHLVLDAVSLAANRADPDLHHDAIPRLFDISGNVGTAYRQRAQLLVFYFIFVAVGFVLV